MSQPVSRPPDLIGRLFHFALHTVLPAAPVGFWWVIGLGLFSLLNLIFQREIWPHTPGANTWFCILGLSCLLVLPWQLGRTANRIADSLRGVFWPFCWRLAGWGAYVAGGLLLLPGIIGLAFLLTADFSHH